MIANPLLDPWTSPFGLPPFDRIRAEHFPPAFRRAMALHREEVAAIAANPARPDFANTIEALERAGALLDRIRSLFFNLVASQASEAMQGVEREITPLLARHRAETMLESGIFTRIEVLHGQLGTLDLDADQHRLLERRYTALVRGGAALAPPERTRLAEIAARLAALHTEFGQNVLHDENDWQLVLTAGDMAGLPDFACRAAQEAARERGLNDEAYVIILARSSIEPFLTFSDRRDLRERAWRAWVARGANPGGHDNVPLIREILALRTEQARLLDFPDFAAFRLADTMAQAPEAVEKLLWQVWEPAKRCAATEQAELEALAQIEGQDASFEAWDWRYWAHRLRRVRHGLDEAALKPFLPMEAILRAAFETANRLFDVNFEERFGLPLYHPDIRAFEMRDSDGAHRGLLLLDAFARPGKRSGAWMGTYRFAEAMDGARVAPIVVNNNNIAKAKPALLSFDEAETLFHEFGHALHGLLSVARYPSQSGTSVLSDFVEFPSQVLEHWLTVPTTLRAHARHHATGEPLPEAMLQSLLEARRFGQGFATVEFVASALIDQGLHRHPAPESMDVEAFERQFLARIGMPNAIGLRHRPAHFQHLFAGSGYAAGYYAYLWAEVLDADAADAFAEAGDMFDPELAARLRAIYEAGDMAAPMDLYLSFRGKAPSIKPLLRHRGLLDD